MQSKEYFVSKGCLFHSFLYCGTTKHLRHITTIADSLLANVFRSCCIRGTEDLFESVHVPNALVINEKPQCVCLLLLVLHSSRMFDS